MADSAAVLQGLARVPGVSYPVLVPNLKGLEAALAAGAREVSVFVAASEAFSRKNINVSIEESLRRVDEVAASALACQVKVRGYISCTLGCPYEGEVALSAVESIARHLFRAGCYEISLGDTIGVGTPARAQAMLRAVSCSVPMEHLAVHFHDTWGQALANIYACLELGVAVVDASVAGLGGCPYAVGASGNVATEDVVYLLNGLGIETGVDLSALGEAGWMICEKLARKPAAKAALALAASRTAVR